MENTAARDTRERLLAATLNYVSKHGIGELTLRQLAAKLGTSHALLTYHFGSKEELFVEVIRAVEARQREVLAELTTDPAKPWIEQLRELWRRISDPSLWPHERLFFEVYGQALQSRPHTAKLLDGIVDSWLEPLTRLNLRMGFAPRAARAHARLSIAVTRGLLLDLLATGDRKGVDEAFELFAASFVAKIPKGRTRIKTR
jgi:AcrR family transcriptional regulator